MCGIAGIVNPDSVQRRALEQMACALAHRGPDDEGFYLEHDPQQQCGLTQRRLSIIDLGGGHQPMANEDQTIWVVFNGEIYNYQQLRPPLEQAGHKFRTNSDTEVIIHAYEQHGDECVKLLRGMFAFALWDEKRRRLLIARDRLGQKPLFYARHQGRLLFASEIKSVLAAAPELRKMNRAALDQYLTLRIIASPLTMFEGISKLPPSHMLTYELATDKLEVSRYWQATYEPKWEGDEQQLTKKLEEAIIECLRLHMIADVPVGAFMSGGLDSTLVVAMLKAHGLAPDLQTFSVSLPYRDLDEAPYARMVAKKYGTIHHEQEIHPSLLSLLPKLVWHLDEPSDPLAVCQYLISQFARQHVKVVLGGEGGDELFGGYDRYYGNRYTSYYAAIPRLLRSGVLGPLLNLVPDGKWYKSKGHQLKWIHQLSYHDGGRRYAKSLGYFYFPDPRKELYGPAMADLHNDPNACIREHYENALAANDIDRMLWADSMVRMPDHPVMILDRMTMAHGLEARAPFMDHVLAEFAARLPVDLKVHGRTTRYIQRKLCEKYLPAELMTRPKQGFHSALPYLLKDEYRLLFDTFLRRPSLVADGLLRQAPIDRLLAEHAGDRADHGQRLWLLLNSEVWYQMHILGRDVEALTEQLARGSATTTATAETAAC
ncbi:MAG: asparagine synthase (glutamine-hydrolyzing) [Phycisphaeraceae bacterium]|nr:asparagine synthase (glutamine-hydrolyzing) [Phycisphaeraceae bacterium]